MTTLEVLQVARALYAANPSHAPLGTYTDDCPVKCIDRAGAWDDEAERALGKAAGLEPELDYQASFYRLSIIRWNAEASTEEVLAAFDKAIATEEAKVTS